VGECWVFIFFVVKVEVDCLTVKLKVEVVRPGKDEFEVDQ
jgi:hypothetical protein